MRKEDWPQEVGKRKVFGNFRASITERRGRTRVDFRKARPGMSPLHLINIRALPCSVCEERTGIQAHHIKFGGARSERGVFLDLAPTRYSCFGHFFSWAERQSLAWSTT